MIEFNLLNITAICTFVSTTITILSYVKNAKFFYRLISILITICFFFLALKLYSNRVGKSIKVDKVENSIEYESLNRKSFLSYRDSLNQDSTDVEYLKKYEVVNSISITAVMMEELKQLVSYSLTNRKYFWAIMFADRISYSSDRNHELIKIIDYTLTNHQNYKFSIIAASEINISSTRSDKLETIVDSCLNYNMFDEAYLAAELISTTSISDRCKRKILNSMTE